MDKHRVIFIAQYPYLVVMLPAMIESRRIGVTVEAFVPKVEMNNSQDTLLEKSVKMLEDEGFAVLREIPKLQTYDILYSAYPGVYKEFVKQNNQIRYHVNFIYGAACANKPHIPSANLDRLYYDFILCMCETDASIYSAHAKTYSIGNIKLASYKRNRILPKNKKTILYLPSWGNVGKSKSGIDLRVIDKLVELQSTYNITTKMHHQTAVAANREEEERRKYFNAFSNIYDETTPIADILNNADIVLSDLSSVAFDAIAGDVPLALYGLGEPVTLGGKLCLHQQLVNDDIIPGTNDANELELVIEKALSEKYFAKQQKLKNEMFLYQGRECLDVFTRFQDDLLHNRVDLWYIATRKGMREYHERNLIDLRHEYETSTSWKVTKPLRAISKLIRGISEEQ